VVFSFLPQHLGHDGNLTGMPLCCRSGLDLLGGSFWGLSEMSNEKDPFHDAEVREAIDLRWTLRDIRAKRWKLSPINPLHLEKLISLGLVEMRNDDPILTNAGLDTIP
jgi:hypothetical protein